jgi:hypothetical protein
MEDNRDEFELISRRISAISLLLEQAGALGPFLYNMDESFEQRTLEFS